MFDKVAIFGVGLIGGSVALALDRGQSVKRVVGVGRSRASLERAVQLGVIDEIARDEADAVRGADVVVIAAPVAQIGPILSTIAPHLGLRTVVTDAGSTKSDVVESARLALGGRLPQFVPSHPIAGSERSGVDAADAALFDGKRCVMTPTGDTAGHAVERIRDLWTACGAHVIEMSASQHDRVFAAVSHLPHLLAFAYVNAIASGDDAETKFAQAGGGFRDFSRIAASSPEMWRDIMIANRPALLRELVEFEQQLALCRHAIETSDGDSLDDIFESARVARSRWREFGGR
ncbi:hypothetical protein BH10PSE17_BH10PSE17_13610 [soil metagenome]